MNCNVMVWSKTQDKPCDNIRIEDAAYFDITPQYEMVCGIRCMQAMFHFNNGVKVQINNVRNVWGVQ